LCLRLADFGQAESVVKCVMARNAVHFDRQNQVLIFDVDFTVPGCLSTTD
jgi:hypothetical protein